jgi:hypothetical protein
MREAAGMVAAAGRVCRGDEVNEGGGGYGG